MMRGTYPHKVTIPDILPGLFRAPSLQSNNAIREFNPMACYIANLRRKEPRNPKILPHKKLWHGLSPLKLKIRINLGDGTILSFQKKNARSTYCTLYRYTTINSSPTSLFKQTTDFRPSFHTYENVRFTRCRMARTAKRVFYGARDAFPIPLYIISGSSASVPYCCGGSHVLNKNYLLPPPHLPPLPPNLPPPLSPPLPPPLPPPFLRLLPSAVL